MIILSPQVIRDRDTGISRGFAFITFHCESTVEALLMQTPHQPQHCIEGKTIRIAAVNQAKGTEAKKKWVPTGTIFVILHEILMGYNNLLTFPSMYHICE